MRNSLLALLLVAIPATAEDGEIPEKTLRECASRDPFTSYLALKEVDEWAARAGVDAKAVLGGMRKTAEGELLLGIDEALDHLAREAGATPPAPRVAEERFGGLLDRIASTDPTTAQWALREFDHFCKRSPKTVRAVMEGRREGAGERRLEGIRQALERLDQWESSWALEEGAKSPDEIRIKRMLVGDEEPKGERPLEQWSRTEPEKALALLKPWRKHADREVAAIANRVCEPLDELSDWFVVSRRLDLLGMPSVRELLRRQVKRPAGATLPRFLGRGDDGDVGCWSIGMERAGRAVLLDDGSIRILPAYQGRSFFGEIRDWTDTRSREPATYDADGFWQAALYGHWCLQLRRIPEAGACFDAARAAAAVTFPGDTPDQLAGRALRLGADRLLRAARDGCGSEELTVELWKRIAALPFEDCRALAVPALEGFHRQEELSKKWAQMAPGDRAKLAAGDRVEEAFWALAESGSPFLKSSGPSALSKEIARADAESPEPFARVASCGLEAIPFLIEKLDDRTPVEIPRGELRARACDAALLLLHSLLRMPLPATPAADAPWLDLAAPAADVKRDLKALWNRLAPLDEGARYAALYREGSRAAEEWLLRHDPAACAADALKALPPEGRARILGARRIVGLMSEAPADKLAALRDASEGELRELAEHAIEGKDASREK